MPTKHEILEELDAIEEKGIAPGKYVRFGSTPSSKKGAHREPVTHEGKVKYIDFSVGDPHKSPTVFYEGRKATGQIGVFKNKATKLEVIPAKRSRS